jgi:Na+-transporting NADH:ubiquinone oxidoreductase subunit C
LQVLNIPLKNGADVVKTFESRVQSFKVLDRTLYKGFHEGGKTLKGYVFPVGGPGFWGPIWGMVAVNPDATRIIGISFYKHSETPGLGGRITEPWFKKQFEGLALQPAEEDRKIFYLKTSGKKASPNELDAITGATGTSRAVEAFLNRELDKFIRDFMPALKKTTRSATNARSLKDRFSETRAARSGVEIFVAL